MLTNTIKNMDNSKKTSDCPLFISQYITVGPNGEILKYIKLIFLCKKDKFFENVVSFLLRLGGRNVWEKLLLSTE